jgi:hypothetical protein
LSCCFADNGTATYTSNVTNSTYMLNTSPANFLDAETNCRLNGGHLTSYASAEEQRDVEAYFVSTGGWPAGFTVHALIPAVGSVP